MSAGEKRWFRVTQSENIPVRQGRVVDFAHLQIAIFNLGDRFMAVESRCPHRGGPLADGIVSGTTVACPLHAWKFDLVTGSAINHMESGACLRTFPVRVEEGIICVEMPVVGNSLQMASAACQHRDLPLRWVQRKPLAPSVELGE